MNFKESFDKCVDFIDIHKKIIIGSSLSMLGLIILMIMFLVSSDEFSIEKESNTLFKNIEQRKYSIALENYENYKSQFSEAKLKRFDKSISKKINKLLLESGDKYINKEITKEQYIGIINTINALSTIEIDLQRILDQAQRLSEMYVNENISYDIVLSYMNSASTLNGITHELDMYKNNIKEIYESRKIYEEANKNENNLMYYEAILGYDKVLEKDKKYYDLAQKQKQKCIEDMYDYYIQKADESARIGNFEESLKYIQYLKKYYEEDENILSLEKEYEKKLSLYTLSSDDIINLISRKNGKSKDTLSISSFYQMIDGEKYYYVEVLEYETLIDEVLINAKTKDIYSYKDSDKDYKTEYSNGYFRYIGNEEIQFAISKEKAQFILSNKLSENEDKYKEISEISKEKANRYIKDKESLDKILGKNEDLYYYELVNKGIFKEKQVYIINMYTEKVYIISEDKISEY